MLQLERFTSLTMEPFCFRPWEIARLTDFQIDALYFDPALKRQAAMDAEIAKAKADKPAAGSAAPSAPAAATDSDLGSLPREQFAEEMAARFGGDVAKHREVWEMIQKAKQDKKGG